MNINKKQLGFSLVEAIVYLAIVGILLTATVSLHLTLGGTADKLSSNILVSRNRRVAMGGIDYLVKNADGLLKDVNGDCSGFASTPPVLALYFEDDNNLPGTCVENGGGVRISVDDKKISLTCYPNMSGNGYYQNCDTSVYPAGNVYYLSSSDVAVLNSSLSFTTSTATSTSNNFTTLSTNLSVGTHSGNQIRLSATSTVTSTVIMRNEQASGLVAWYELNSGDDATEAIDVVNGLNMACDDEGVPGSVDGLVDGSTRAYDFNKADTDRCNINNSEVFNFSNAFTITAWINMDYTDNAYQSIFYKSVYGDNQGYRLMIHLSSGNLYFRICDNTACTDVLTASAIISNDTIYHVSAVYDLDNDEARMYVYQKGVGGISTTTASSIPVLVNTSKINYPRMGDYFDGQIDELRIYDRALSNKEIWALQSQGAN